MAALALLSALALPPIHAAAVPPDTPVDIDGGGAGHGIGMPQWGAYFQADDGWRWRQIIRYWYDGVGFDQASDIPGVPDLVRVGIDHVKVGGVNQYRPFLWLDFEAIGGVVRICLDGESGEDCSLEAEPGIGEVWRMSWVDGTGCVLTENQVTRHSGPCGIHLEWDDQPNTRVAFPELQAGWGLGDFARGTIWFDAPKQAVWNGSTRTGFHIVIEMTFDEYTYGLAEVPASWPQHAMRAQAVAARTYAAWRARSTISSCSCNLFWDNRHQSYRGWHQLNEGNATYGDKWRRAVDLTAGKVVVYPAGSTTIAETYYFTSSGGATENVWDVWGPDTPAYREKYAYLASQADPWSELAADFAWGVRWTKETTAGAIASSLGLDELVSLSIEGVRESGSPDRITAAGTAHGLLSFDSYTGNQLQSRLGLTPHTTPSMAGRDPVPSAAPRPRADAAAAVSAELFPDGAATVFLTVGSNHDRAMTLGPAAVYASAPILMLEPGGVIPEMTATELVRLDPGQVVVVATEDAVPDATLSGLATLVPDAMIGRISRSNRYTTSAALSAAVFAPEADVVYISSGRAIHALLASHAASLNGDPVLLVRTNSIPNLVAQELARLDPERIVVIGSTDRVSAAVFDALSGYAPEIERIDVDGRFPLSIALSERAHPEGADTVYLSIGRSHPWSLTGSMEIGMDGGPVLMVKRGSIPSAIAAELARLAPSRITLLSAPQNAYPGLITALAALVGA